jgi:phosphate transport system protein
MAFEDLKQTFYGLCELVEDTFDKSAKALLTNDSKLAEEVIEQDKKIDHLEIAIEEECLKILALYRPVAAELRFIITLLKINNDLERIGDLSSNIAKKVIYLVNHDVPPCEIDLVVMIDKTKEMLKKCLKALVQMDARLAYDVCQMDDIVDYIKKQSGKEILGLMKNDPDKVNQLIKLFTVTRNIERVADLATNISEDVIYCVEGDIIRHKFLATE